MHGRALILVMAAASLLGGCGYNLTPRAKAQLEGARQQYQAGNLQGSIANSDAFIRENSRSKFIDEAYYFRGLARYELAKPSGNSSQLELAKADLEAALSKARSNDLRAKASKTLGDLCFDTHDNVLAERMYRYCLANTSGPNPLACQAQYRLGRTLQRLDRWAHADRVYHKVIYDYPGTQEAKSAAAKVNARAWTVQAGAFQTMAAAQVAVARLRGKNLPAVAVAQLSEGRARYVVQVGRYPRFEQVSAMVKQVQTVQHDAFATETR